MFWTPDIIQTEDIKVGSGFVFNEIGLRPGRYRVAFSSESTNLGFLRTEVTRLDFDSLTPMLRRITRLAECCLFTKWRFQSSDHMVACFFAPRIRELFTASPPQMVHGKRAFQSSPSTPPKSLRGGS
jgi:hypothetical protein